jgi:hypothetical protein
LNYGYVSIKKSFIILQLTKALRNLIGYCPQGRHPFIYLRMKIPDRINTKKIVQKMNLGWYCLKMANWPDEVHFEDGRNVYSSQFGFPGLVILSLISLS